MVHLSPANPDAQRRLPVWPPSPEQQQPPPLPPPPPPPPSRMPLWPPQLAQQPPLDRPAAVATGDAVAWIEDLQADSAAAAATTTTAPGQVWLLAAAS